MLPAYRKELMVVCTSIFVELFASKLVGKIKRFGTDEMELFCSDIVPVIWLEYVDVISVVIIDEKFDGLLYTILLEDVGFNEIDPVDTDFDEVGILVIALVDWIVCDEVMILCEVLVCDDVGLDTAVTVFVLASLV